MQPEPDRSLYRGLSVPTDLSSHTETSARCSCLPLWLIIGFYVQFTETTWKLSFLMSREICFQWAAQIITGHRNCSNWPRDGEASAKQNPPETLHFRQEYWEGYFRTNASDVDWFSPTTWHFSKFWNSCWRGSTFGLYSTDVRFASRRGNRLMLIYVKQFRSDRQQPTPTHSLSLSLYNT